MKYTGGCHCGKVRFEVVMDLKEAIECNCSLCYKRGGPLAFVPATAFNLLHGEKDLTDYQFNKFIINHYFCSTCGIQSFSEGKGVDGEESRAINLLCIDDLDLSTIKIKHFDGKSR
jgi:hypothetical protein